MYVVGAILVTQQTFSLCPCSHTRGFLPGPDPTTAAPACPSAPGWPSGYCWGPRAPTGAAVCPHHTHPAAPSALQLISPATPAAPHTFQPCPHLSCLCARRTLEGPDRILLTPLCWLSPNLRCLYPCYALPFPLGQSAPSLVSYPITLP